VTIPSALVDRLRNIRLLILDVDGVLTDGSVNYTADGTETKTFNVKDGLGLRLLMDHGVTVAIVTGRRSEALGHRCRDLGIELVLQGVQDKSRAFSAIVCEKGLTTDQVAVVGDDLPELPLMKAAGMAVAVADAHPLVIAAAHMVTSAGGGRGAVRQVCEWILEARGSWNQVLARFGAGSTC
jgi:3-deoxy-D-manno-octulosonate 8-phosphate phosphatase (KDO 8-P phosphatase)